MILGNSKNRPKRVNIILLPFGPPYIFANQETEYAHLVYPCYYLANRNFAERPSSEPGAPAKHCRKTGVRCSIKLKANPLRLLVCSVSLKRLCRDDTPKQATIAWIYVLPSLTFKFSSILTQFKIFNTRSIVKCSKNKARLLKPDWDISPEWGFCVLFPQL
jgi:hypothetical protein